MNDTTNKRVSKFERNKYRLIELRHEGLGSARIAKELGVARSTVGDWLKRVVMNGYLKEYKPGNNVNNVQYFEMIELNCSICDGLIRTNNKNTMYCSEKCRRVHQMKVQTTNCIKCDAVINIKKKVCKHCKEEERKRGDIRRQKKEAISNLIKAIDPNRYKDCIYCGSKFYARYMNRDYCTRRCGELSYYERTKESVHYYRQCVECSKHFDTTHSKIICCSDDCKKKRSNRINYLKRKTIIKENGKADWDISIKKLSKKDKSICHLCNDKVSRNDFYYTDEGHFIAGDSYPSIDHVRPISKGGTHTWDNVRLAHRICNSIKHDNESEEPEQLELQIWKIRNP